MITKEEVRIMSNEELLKAADLVEDMINKNRKKNGGLGKRFSLFDLQDAIREEIEVREDREILPPRA